MTLLCLFIVAFFDNATIETGYYLKLDLLNSGFSVLDSFSSKYFNFECVFVQGATLKVSL